MELQALVHVTDMKAAIRFYEALGAEVVFRNSDDDWAKLRFGDGEIGLLAHPPNPEQSEDWVELNFAEQRQLRDVEQELRGAGITVVKGATETVFGEQLQIESPDGLLIKINRMTN